MLGWGEGCGGFMMDAMWMEIGEEMRGSFRVTGGGGGGEETPEREGEEGNSVSLCDFFSLTFTLTFLFIYCT